MYNANEKCHGFSRPYHNFSYPNIIDDLKTILDKENIKKAIFIGQSFGGMIAQYFIDRYPNMALGLIAIDSAPFGDYYSKLDLFWLEQLEWLSRLIPDRILRKSMAKVCTKTKYVQDKMMEEDMVLLSRGEIIDLIEEIIKSSNKSEEYIDRLIEKLEQGVLDPEICNYIFWSEMCPEEIADKALSYKPIQL